MSCLFVRRADRKRCRVTFEDVGPLFAAAKCNQRGEWEIDGQPHCGRLCLVHMLEHLDDGRRHQIGCDGFGAARPALCGGHTFCLGLECAPHCRRHCRAQAEPLWLHIRLTLPTMAFEGDTRRRAYERRWRRRALVAKRRASRA